MKKPKPVKRRKVPKLSEQEFVRETVSEAAGVHFEVVAPHPAFPLAVDKLNWFMRCRNAEEIAKAPYVNAVWKEKGSGIWLESLAVGDTVDWIELAYGDEKAGESLDIDYSRLDDPTFKEELRSRFPIVMDRIKEYEAAAAGVAKARKVHVELRRAGSKGMLVFTAASLVKAKKGTSQRSLGNALKKSVAALKEAYDQIAKLWAGPAAPTGPSQTEAALGPSFPG